MYQLLERKGGEMRLKFKIWEFINFQISIFQNYIFKNYWEINLNAEINEIKFFKPFKSCLWYKNQNC